MMPTSSLDKAANAGGSSPPFVPGKNCRVLVFAHVPPPLHGQSQMVQWLVEGLGRRRDLRVEVLHVDARLSTDLTDVGAARGGKLGLLFGYVRQALRLRFSEGVKIFYYVPSPPKRNSLYRDWMVLLAIRLFFRRTIFHWHAVGLGAWLEEKARPWERWVSWWLLGRSSLSIILAETNRSDAEKFKPRACISVANGIPDPCPDYARSLAEVRLRQGLARRVGQVVVPVLYLAHCTRDKGLFDAVSAVLEANRLGSGTLRFVLTVAGTFVTADEERDFKALLASTECQGVVRYIGFVSGDSKTEAFRSHELFLFPTYFANEGQPVNLIEAMAWGLPVVTTRWRAIPEFFDSGYKGLVEPRDSPAAGAALLAVAQSVDAAALRARFESAYSIDRHLEAMAAAFHSVAV
ncbi:MAG TPA: glycosyltransferase [Candidatus Limnocylindria bacterium]|jgi:glycosyltransferase involved in cell wall biosynthesis|nr:glycosyltransferase [Candidatus Limnocylindria bacterium]